MDKTTGYDRTRAVIAYLKGSIRAHGYTDAEFAGLIGVKPQQLSAWLTGKYEIRMSVVYQCIDALGMRDEDFFAGARKLYESTR